MEEGRWQGGSSSDARGSKEVGRAQDGGERGDGVNDAYDWHNVGQARAAK